MISLSINSLTTLVYTSTSHKLYFIYSLHTLYRNCNTLLCRALKAVLTELFLGQLKAKTQTQRQSISWKRQLAIQFLRLLVDEFIFGFYFWNLVSGFAFLVTSYCHWQWHVHCNRFAKCLFKKFDWILHLMHCVCCCCCSCCWYLYCCIVVLWLVWLLFKWQYCLPLVYIVIELNSIQKRNLNEIEIVSFCGFLFYFLAKQLI